MKPLKQLQQQFASDLESTAKIVPSMQCIAENGPLSPEQRFSIYRDSVATIFSKSLAALYPVCEKLVGSDFFNALAAAYRQAHVSHSPDLNDYGEAFVDFVAQFSPTQSLPYLADVARLEQAWQCAFLNESVSMLDMSALAQQQPDSLYLNLLPGCTLLDSVYPIDKIWQVNQDDYTDEPIVDLDEGGVDLMVYRAQWDIVMKRITAPQAFLLKYFAQGLSLDAVTIKALAQTPVIDIVVVLPQLVQLGCLGYRHRIQAR